MIPTRREVLVRIAALATPSAVEGQAAFLSAPELECLKALVDAIIPRTDTPGASDAGVPATIDRRLADSPPFAERFRSGMKALDGDAQSRFGAVFSALTPQQQVELLTPRGQDPFFRMVKDMTVDAYYTSKEGLATELGWHGNTFLPEFKGCTHPEHQK
jgi:gluconate 2-dehydrogenase gamma chain